MVHLVSTGDSQGYSHALLKSFGFEENLEDIPSKGSFSKARQKVSYQFFADRHDDQLKKFEPHRRTFRGLRLYATDGQMWILPRTDDIVEAGFNGRAIGTHRESYMPRGYLTHCYDVLSGVTKDLRFGPRLNEIADAAEMALGLESNSLTLYDRLYFCKKIADAHFETKSFFLARAKTNSVKEMGAFLKDKKRRKIAIKYHGRTLYLVKIWNEREKEWVVYITNLSGSWIKPKLIHKLYRLRWEVEGSFRELTATTKVEQWHSKFLNGILQELFTMFWLINFVKIQTYFRVKHAKNPLRDEYKKPNFKLLFNWIAWNFAKIIERVRGVLDEMGILIRKSTERRIHESRRYKREIKSPASPYSYNNTVWVI